jgi:hypothetical protein
VRGRGCFIARRGCGGGDVAKYTISLIYFSDERLYLFIYFSYPCRPIARRGFGGGGVTFLSGVPFIPFNIESPLHYIFLKLHHLFCRHRNDARGEKKAPPTRPPIPRTPGTATPLATRQRQLGPYDYELLHRGMEPRTDSSLRRTRRGRTRRRRTRGRPIAQATDAPAHADLHATPLLGVVVGQRFHAAAPG